MFLDVEGIIELEKIKPNGDYYCIELKEYSNRYKYPVLASDNQDYITNSFEEAYDFLMTKTPKNFCMPCKYYEFKICKLTSFNFIKDSDGNVINVDYDLEDVRGFRKGNVISDNGPSDGDFTYNGNLLLEEDAKIQFLYMLGLDYENVDDYTEEFYTVQNDYEKYILYYDGKYKGYVNLHNASFCIK